MREPPFLFKRSPIYFIKMIYFSLNVRDGLTVFIGVVFDVEVDWGLPNLNKQTPAAKVASPIARYVLFSYTSFLILRMEKYCFCC